MPLTPRFRRFFKIDPAMILSPPTIHSFHVGRWDVAEEGNAEDKGVAQETGGAEAERNGGDAESETVVS